MNKILEHITTAKAKVIDSINEVNSTFKAKEYDYNFVLEAVEYTYETMIGAAETEQDFLDIILTQAVEFFNIL